MTDYTNGTWGRPNPPRLNDTAAIVRKGTYPYTLKTDQYCGQMPCETPFVAENTFNRKSPDVCITPPQGAGMAVMARHRMNGNGGRGGSPDRNTMVPGSGSSLAGGVAEVHKSGRGR
jgi:hypothetical protein